MKRKFKAFIPIVLICTMLIGNFCYASSVDDTLTTVFDSVAEAISGWLASDYGLIIPSSAFYARALSTYDIAFPDAEEDFDDYVEDNTTIDDGNLVVNVDLANFLIDVANKYVEDNPLGYSIQNIYPINNISSQYFKYGESWNAFVEWCHSLSLDGINFVFVPNNSTTSISAYPTSSDGSTKSFSKLEMHYKSSNDIYFYSSSGHHDNFVSLTDLIPTVNWSSIKPSNSSSNKVNYSERWSINGTFLEPTDDVGIDVIQKDIYGFFRPSYFNTLSNANFLDNSTGFCVYNTSDSVMKVFVFDSIDAIKVHNTAQPSSYYYSDYYKGSDFVYSDNSVVSTNNVLNNSNTYNQIVNSLERGLSAQELTIIVNNIIDSNNNPSPTPTPPSDDDGGSGSDDKESLWDKIKDKVGDFFGAIADVITGLVELIVGTVLTVLTDLIKGFGSILSSMKDFFLGGEDTEGFFSLMSGFFDWLPEPLPLMIKSIFTLACVFALIRMIKGLAS